MKLSLLLVFSLVLQTTQAVAAESSVLHIATYEHITNLKVTQELQKYVADALKKENIQVVYYPAPIMRGASLVNEGNIDGKILSSKDNLKYFSDITLLPNPLAFADHKIVYLKDNKKYSYENLSKLQGAIILNNTAIRDIANKKPLQLIEVRTIPEAFEALKKRRVDYLILSEDVAKDFLQAGSQNKKLFVIDSPVIEKVPFYFALSKRKSFLIPKVEKALRNASREDLRKYPNVKDLINRNF